MANIAKVDSIDAIRAFRAVLWKFKDAANVALADAESEVSRIHTWLETEQQQHWTTQIRKRSEIVARCKEAVRMKKLFKDSSGRTQSAVDEEKALAIALKRLAEAEQKLVLTKQHSRRVVKEFQNYKGSVQRFATAVQSDIPVAVAHLDALTRILDQYLSTDAPAGGGESPGETGSTAAMTRATGGDAKQPAAEEHEVYVTDLSDFPEIHEPQVVLVRAEAETGIVVLEDGARYKGTGERYKIFDSLDDALAYANQKIAAEPKIECAIFGDASQLLKVVRDKSGDAPIVSQPV